MKVWNNHEPYLFFRILYDKIDADHDGQVTETELEQWIHKVQRKYLVEDTKRQWEEHNPEDEKLSWQSYKKRTYGFTEDDRNYFTFPRYRTIKYSDLLP